MSANAAEIAKHFAVDPATVRRWPNKGCPIIRRGKRGPGRGALFDLNAVAKWRAQRVNIGLSVDEALQSIAIALRESLEKDALHIRAGSSREDAAAVLLLVWERVRKNFNRTFRFDKHPEPIRALMHEL